MSSLSREAPDAHDVRGEDFRAKNGFFSARQCVRRRRRAPQGYKEQTHTYKPHFAAQGKRCGAPGKANYDAGWKAELQTEKRRCTSAKASGLPTKNRSTRPELQNAFRPTLQKGRGTRKSEKQIRRPPTRKVGRETRTTAGAE
jgi:hypothetical protein